MHDTEPNYIIVLSGCHRIDLRMGVVRIWIWSGLKRKLQSHGVMFRQMRICLNAFFQKFKTMIDYLGYGNEFSRARGNSLF